MTDKQIKELINSLNFGVEKAGGRLCTLTANAQNLDSIENAIRQVKNDLDGLLVLCRARPLPADSFIHQVPTTAARPARCDCGSRGYLSHSDANAGCPRNRKN